MMAIAASNLFARNIWTQYLRPKADSEEQTRVSKTVSLFMKLGAVAFVVIAPTTYVVNFQLAGGIWMLQVLPAVFLALYIGWLDARAVIAGWVTGIAFGTWSIVLVHFRTTSYSYSVFGYHNPVYIGIPALALNLLVVFIGSALANLTSLRPAPLAPSGDTVADSGSLDRRRKTVR
jgi:SSS family solute:Na+ symporter